MRTVDLRKDKLDLQGVISLARQEAVLLLTSDGQEFCIAPADDFEREVESLRASQAFQSFLDERSACRRRIPLEEIEREVEQELAERQESV